MGRGALQTEASWKPNPRRKYSGGVQRQLQLISVIEKNKLRVCLSLQEPSVSKGTCVACLVLVLPALRGFGKEGNARS